MNVTEMTRKDFEALPRRKWDEDIGQFDALVIIPGRAKELHDSGYRLMDFVAVRGGEPVCLMSGCSDVLHLDGIGGYGYNWLDKFGYVPGQVPVVGWTIDCLPKSGLLCLFAGSRPLIAGQALSSFEIYAVERKKEATNDRETR